MDGLDSELREQGKMSTASATESALVRSSLPLTGGERGQWQLTVDTPEGVRRYRCGFLMMCAGYWLRSGL